MRLHLLPFLFFFFFFGGATLSLLQLLQRSYMLYEITNVLQNLRCCMSVCLRETEIEQSHLCCYVNLFFWFCTFFQCFIKKNLVSFYIFQDFQDIFHVLPSSLFFLHIPLCQPSGVPCEVSHVIFLNKWLVLISF